MTSREFLSEELASLVPVLPMNADVAETYGLIRHDLTRRGEIIGNNDLWIAAHALSLDLTLVTNNERVPARKGLADCQLGCCVRTPWRRVHPRERRRSRRPPQVPQPGRAGRVT